MFRIHKWVVTVGLLYAFKDGWGGFLIKRLNILIIGPIKLSWGLLLPFKFTSCPSVWQTPSLCSLTSGTPTDSLSQTYCRGQLLLLWPAWTSGLSFHSFFGDRGSDGTLPIRGFWWAISRHWFRIPLPIDWDFFSHFYSRVNTLENLESTCLSLINEPSSFTIVSQGLPSHNGKLKTLRGGNICFHLLSEIVLVFVVKWRTPPLWNTFHDYFSGRLNIAPGDKHKIGCKFYLSATLISSSCILGQWKKNLLLLIC